MIIKQQHQSCFVKRVFPDTGLDMRSADMFYGSMRKVMLALIGEPPSSPSPEPLPCPLSEPMGCCESMFDEDLADNLTPLDRVRWVVGDSHSSIAVT